jgi:hypothetical protein
MKIKIKKLKNTYYECIIEYKNKYYKGYGINDDKEKAQRMALDNAWSSLPQNQCYHDI